MFEKKPNKQIESIVKEFFKKMTISEVSIKVNLSDADLNNRHGEEGPKQVINLDITLVEPQVLIGQGGQTLFEVQRILKNIINRRLKQFFYLNVDINDYKRKKLEYLKDLAKNLADDVTLTKKEKTLLPMSAYERRVVHSELSQRTDITTESQGEGADRHIVIKPK